MRGQKHSHSLSNLSQNFSKKVTERHPAGHHQVPPVKELRQSHECFHCHNKGHYTRNCRTRKKAMCKATPATIKVTNTANSNRYKALEEESLDTPQPPTASQFKKAIQKLTSSTLTMKQPQGTKRLDAKEIQELIQANITRYSLKERAELTI